MDVCECVNGFLYILNNYYSIFMKRSVKRANIDEAKIK